MSKKFNFWKFIPAGIPCLVIVFGMFAYIGSIMGVPQMLNTIMKTAHDLLLNTCFYLMAICVITGAIGKIFMEFGVVNLLEKLFYSENWSTVSISNGASNVKATLSITTNLSKANNSVVKIGSTVTINEPTLTQTENKANATISGFDYGKYSLDGTSKITGTSVSKTWSYDKTNQPTF